MFVRKKIFPISKMTKPKTMTKIGGCMCTFAECVIVILELIHALQGYSAARFTSVGFL